MQNQIQNFSFNNQSLQIIIKDNQAWFIASEVANLLGYLKASDLTRILDDDEKGTHNMRTLGGNQDVSIINESGFYHAAFKSRKPEVKPFRKWVTSEVLPQIRKTGGYTLKLTPAQKQQIQAAVNRRVHRTGETHQNIYRAIHELAQVASYHDIAAADFERVMAYLDGDTALVSAAPISQDLFRHLAKMAMYAGHWANFQRLMCQNPNNNKTKELLNELAYSTCTNQTGFLFIFKPDVANDIKQAVDWLHAQSSHYALAE